MNRKDKSFKRRLFLSENKIILRCQKLQHVFERFLSALTQTNNRFSTFYSFIALPNADVFEVGQCRKLYAVHMRQVATVIMETTQLVLSQFKNFYRSQLTFE